MKIRMCIAIFILLSFFNIGAISQNLNSNKNSLITLEPNLRNVSEFEESGIKLQYRTKDNIEKETIRVKKFLTYNINGNYEEGENNQFQISNRDFNVSAKLWKEDMYNYVEIILINKNSKYLMNNLTNILQKIVNEKSENVQYFSYYEGKELDSHYSIDKFISNNNLKNTEILKINNGYTGTGIINNNDKINFALVEYNTGSHIMVGTPIIFTTY